ncbi:putative phosphatidate phosphatase [Rosa chinensis]|uniref:Putative phosphatidate phosphatase n=1 Tax=Rosa chinensis TaxID=74649 RepID=A0A2P6RP60_ROSCH|nr:putative phosphatidate phosphatase [Rosa chinensis]
MLVGIPTILILKFCSKALAKCILPVVSYTLGIPIKSSNGEKSDGLKHSGYLQKLYLFSSQDSFDVDASIRFIQYIFWPCMVG